MPKFRECDMASARWITIDGRSDEAGHHRWKLLGLRLAFSRSWTDRSRFLQERLMPVEKRVGDVCAELPARDAFTVARGSGVLFATATSSHQASNATSTCGP